MTEIEYQNKLAIASNYEIDIYNQLGIRLSKEQIYQKLKEEKIFDIYMKKKIYKERKHKMKNIL
jgi:hypothetical protein